MRRLVPVTVVLLALLGSTVPAGAFDEAAVTVDAFDMSPFDLFDPSAIELRRGGVVTFVFGGTKSHTATDGTGLGLYDSGPVAPGGPDLIVTFVAAGRYSVVCSLHAAMDAEVDVPVSVSPATASRGGRLTVTWASEISAGQLVYDVQLRKPGGSWAIWRNDAAARKGSIEVRRTGTWRFRARLVRAGTDAGSAWSRVATASVG